MSNGECETQDGPVLTLRQLLKGHRVAVGMTQAALATQVGLTGGMISQVELGQRNLSRESVDRVATTLQLTSSERNSFYTARETAADNLSERKPKGFDASFALGLAEIDAELATLGDTQDPDSVDRRRELYEQRDRMTNKDRETESVLRSARLALAERKIIDFMSSYDRALKAAFRRIEVLEREVEQLATDGRRGRLAAYRHLVQSSQ